MNSETTFRLFGVAHIVVIAIAVGMPLALAVMTRRGTRRVPDRIVRWILVSILVANYIGYAVYQLRAGSFRWQEALPFQLCDWTMFVVIVALLTAGRPRWLEVAYFWGIGGTLQAVITPNLAFGFPDIRFFAFFAAHCGIAIGVLYLMVSRRFRPTVASIWRTLAWSEFYLVVTLFVDWMTGVNYGFLLHKPAAVSILDYLSDARAVYILQLNALALVFFALLYAPFAIADLVNRQRA